MKPTAIPVAIEPVKGIMIIVRKAGTANSKRFQSICPNEDTIKTPTIISAGAVTALVTTDNTGEKNNASKNKIPVTIEAKPVRAPAATPEDDSTYDVTVEVPKIEPAIVAIESEINAFLHVVSGYLLQNLLGLLPP